MRYAQAVYQMHVRDQGGIRYTKLQDMDLNRLYAEGRQPVEKYLDLLCPKGADGKRRTYLDISTDILSVIHPFRPKILIQVTEKNGGVLQRLRALIVVFFMVAHANEVGQIGGRIQYIHEIMELVRVASVIDNVSRVKHE